MFNFKRALILMMSAAVVHQTNVDASSRNNKSNRNNSRAPANNTAIYVGKWKGTALLNSNCPAVAKIPGTLPFDFTINQGLVGNASGKNYGRGTPSGNTISFSTAGPVPGNPSCTLTERLTLRQVAGNSASLQGAAQLSCPVFKINCSINTSGSVKK
jgi:hypothetical protein